MRQGLGLALILVAPLAGCAFHTTTPAPPLGPEPLPLSRTEGAVTIEVDPYFDAQRQRAVFGENLLDEDVLAVRVHVRNAGPGRAVLHPSEMAIEFPDGRSLLPSSAAIVAMKVTGGTGGVIGSGILFGGLGFALAWNAREQAKADRIKDYADKELQVVALSRDESRHGFVFFIASPKVAFREGTLVARLIDAEGGPPRTVRLSLSGTDSTGVPRGR